MVVVDASAIVALIDGGPDGAAVADSLDGHALVAPHLLDQEVMQAVRRRVRGEMTTPDLGRLALDRFARLRIHRLATEMVTGRAWALRDSVTAYDAAYLALAEALDVPLVTVDARLGRSHGSRATVEVVAAEGG